MHLLILASLDRCDAQYEANGEKVRKSQIQGKINSATTTPSANSNNNRSVVKSTGISYIDKNINNINLPTSNNNNANISLVSPFALA